MGTLPIISQGNKLPALYFTPTLSHFESTMRFNGFPAFSVVLIGAILFLGSVDASDRSVDTWVPSDECERIVQDIMTYELHSCNSLWRKFGTDWIKPLRERADLCPEHRSSILQDIYSLLRKSLEC